MYMYIFVQCMKKYVDSTLLAEEFKKETHLTNPYNTHIYMYMYTCIIQQWNTGCPALKIGDNELKIL